MNKYFIVTGSTSLPMAANTPEQAIDELRTEWAEWNVLRIDVQTTKTFMTMDRINEILRRAKALDELAEIDGQLII